MANKAKIYSMAAYLAGDVSYREYYGQFVTPYLLEAIEGQWSPKYLSDKLEKDEHLNNIPLGQWDMLMPYVGTSDVVCRAKQAGDYLTMAMVVCIAKEAALELIEAYRGGYGIE